MALNSSSLQWKQRLASLRAYSGLSSSPVSITCSGIQLPWRRLRPVPCRGGPGWPNRPRRRAFGRQDAVSGSGQEGRIDAAGVGHHELAERSQARLESLPLFQFGAISVAGWAAVTSVCAPADMDLIIPVGDCAGRCTGSRSMMKKIRPALKTVMAASR